MSSTNKGFFGPDWVPAAEPSLVITSSETIEKLGRYERTLKMIAEMTPQDLPWDTTMSQWMRECAKGALDA